MNPDPIDPLLSDYSREPVPDTPKNFQEGVWREIARRRHTSFWSRILPLLEFRELFSEPRLAAAAFTMAIAIGVVPAAVWTRLRSEQRLARDSIHFDVFAATPAIRLASVTTR